MQQVYAIVVAAGSGTRFGADIPKQFCLLKGRPVLMHTLQALHDARPDMALIVVLAPSMADYWLQLCSQYAFSLPHSVVPGGATRWASVRNGLTYIKNLCPSPSDDSLVLVHDGARPLVTPQLMADLIDTASLPGVHGAIPAVQPSDSMRQLAPDCASIPLPRSSLLAVQTPQAFPLSLLLQAYSLPYNPSFTDDASVMEAAGFHNLRLSPADPYNIKITHPLDLAVAAAIIEARKTSFTD